MTPYHVAQVGVALVVAAVAAHRVREVAVRAPVDATSLGETLDVALEAGEMDSARDAAARALPSWAGHVAHAALWAAGEGAVLEALDDAVSLVRAEAMRGRLALRVLASVASAVGLIGAIFHLGGMSRDPLLSLVPVIAERVALKNALSSMALGLATALLAVFSRATIVRLGDRFLAGAEALSLRLPISLGALPRVELRHACDVERPEPGP